MGTNKEQTARISFFQGIARNLTSELQPPSKFYATKNMHCPSNGALKVIPGVSEMTNQIPGCTRVNYIAPIKNPHSNGYIINYESATILPLPTATYSTNGGSAYTATIGIEFVGPCGVRSFITTSQSIQANGLNITITNSPIPSTVWCINFWRFDTDWIWCGALYRKADGTINNTFNMLANVPTITAPIVDQPTAMTATPIVAGNLSPGVYYFGYSPWGSDFSATVNLTDTSQRYFAATLPPGYGGFTFQFTGMAGTVSGTAYSYCVVWMGVTPEDLMPIGIVNGQCNPLLRTAVAGGITISQMSQSINMIPTMNTRSLPGNVMQSYAAQNRQVAYAPLTPTPDYGLIGSSFQGNASNYGSGLVYKNPEDGTCRHIFGSIRPSAYTLKSAASEVLNRAGEGVPGIVALMPELMPNQTFRPTPMQTWSKNLPYDSGSYEDRLYLVNAWATPIYTNGYTASFVVRDYQTSNIPITSSIVFFKDMMVLAGGTSSTFSTQIGTSTFNQRGIAFYSVAGNPRSFTTTPSATPVTRFLGCTGSDNTGILGLGVFGSSFQSGPNSFVAIGKEGSTFVWNGQDTGSGFLLIEVGKGAGWFNSNSFAQTPYGSFMLSPSGVYRYADGSFEPTLVSSVEGIFPILRNQISESLISNVIALNFTDNRLVIGYNDVPPDTDEEKRVYRKEIWIDFVLDAEGKTTLIPTGPHELSPYSVVGNLDMNNSPWGYERISNQEFAYGTLVRRDHLSLDLGDEIPVSLETNNLAFGMDEFVKVLTGFYMRLRTTQPIEVKFTATCYDSESLGDGLDVSGDGVKVFTETYIVPHSGLTPAFRLFQKFFSERFYGDLISVKVEFEAYSQIEITQMNILFAPTRRRLL